MSTIAIRDFTRHLQFWLRTRNPARISPNGQRYGEYVTWPLLCEIYEQKESCADTISDQPPKSLNDLPNELIIQIISCIDQYHSERIIGHIPDDPPPSSPDLNLVEDFLACGKTLRSLALTSRRFRDTAQEYLLRAPILEGLAYDFEQPLGTSRIAFFLRTLFARPELRRHVRQIRICIPMYNIPDVAAMRFRFLAELDGGRNLNTWHEPLDFQDIMRQSHVEVRSAKCSENTRKSLESQIWFGTIGLLLTLLPQLECLSISEQSVQVLNYGIANALDMLGAHRERLLYLPAPSSLRRLVVSSLLPLFLPGLNAFPNLDRLQLALKLAGSDGQTVAQFETLFVGPGACTNYGRIRHLRIDCQVKTAGIWDFAARSNMTHILKAFQELETLVFYAEPSHEKNPYRSVRAFPHYQANIQTYPHEPTPLDRDATQASFWDERVYDARTEWTDYQYLVDSLVHIRSNLQILRLPGGFWTLPGAMRKPLPSFTASSSLQRLVLPQAAILSIKLNNMRFAETEHRDFELLPTSVLPPKLQYLKIFDADAELLKSAWLVELFDEQAARTAWTDLLTLEILFGPTFNDIELADLLARKTWAQFWESVDAATFRVLLDRDDELPMVCE